MYKYYTKRFFGGNTLEIDEWLNGMVRPDLSAVEGRDIEIVSYLLETISSGYIVNVLITIKRWEKC